MTIGVEKSPINMIAGEALLPHRFVKLSGSTANTVVYADSGNESFGVTLARADSGAMVAIELLATSQTIKVVAAGSITVNSAVYVANDGKASGSVAGRMMGYARTTGVADEPMEMVPFARAGATVDTDEAILEDDFFSWTDGDLWLADANDAGAVAETDAHGGVITLSASDGSAADNDETYLISSNEVYKPAVGEFNGEVLAVLEARVKLTEAATDDANIAVGLLSHGADVANTIADNGGITDADTFIMIHKDDGGTVWQASLRDAAKSTDTDIGAFTTNTWHKVKFVIHDADISDGELEVQFFVDGVLGGSDVFILSNAAEMRLLLGVKNGGAAAEVLSVDKIRFAFKR